jgi:hypothetical protein
VDEARLNLARAFTRETAARLEQATTRFTAFVTQAELSLSAPVGEA